MVGGLEGPPVAAAMPGDVVARPPQSSGGLAPGACPCPNATGPAGSFAFTDVDRPTSTPEGAEILHICEATHAPAQEQEPPKPVLDVPVLDSMDYTDETLGAEMRTSPGASFAISDSSAAGSHACTGGIDCANNAERTSTVEEQEEGSDARAPIEATGHPDEMCGELRALLHEDQRLHDRGLSEASEAESEEAEGLNESEVAESSSDESGEAPSEEEEEADEESEEEEEAEGESEEQEQEPEEEAEEEETIGENAAVEAAALPPRALQSSRRTAASPAGGMGLPELSQTALWRGSVLSPAGIPRSGSSPCLVGGTPSAPSSGRATPGERPLAPLGAEPPGGRDEVVQAARRASSEKRALQRLGEEPAALPPPQAPRPRPRVPIDSLRAHAQDIIRSRLRQVDEQVPLPPGLHPAQAVRYPGSVALPPKYTGPNKYAAAVAQAKHAFPSGDAWEYDQIPCVQRDSGGHREKKELRRQAASGRSQARLSSLSNVYGRLSQDRALPKVQSLPAIQTGRSPHVGQRDMQALLRPLPQRLLDMR